MRGILLFLLLTIPQFLTAQRFYSVVFDQLPKDMQMYARDDDNLARIPISGKIEIPDWSHMSAVVYRNGTRYGYGEAGFDYKGGDTAQFQMEVAIEAEPADYTIEVWACRVPGEDSALIVTRNDIAAGDFYLITGQSNGAALQFDNWSSKYCRTIARIPDNNPATSPADTLWIPSSWSHPFTGAWGIHLQRLILENHQIPTTIINASIPGAKISHFVIRNDNNPADPNNLYGALLYRLNIAKPKRVRGFFWFQGEQEAIENIPGYESYFDQLYQYWMEDFTSVEKFFILQTNVIFSNTSPEIRDFQRRTKYIYPKTDHFSTLGVPLSDDRIHYLLDGYKELARRLFYFLEPQYYGVDFNPEVRSPAIQKVFYSSPEKDEITLVFDEGQQMEWPADSTVIGRNGADLLISNRDFFFFDRDASAKAPIQQGVAEGNRVVLRLSESVNGKTLTYIPIEEPENLDVPQGPYLRNSRKLGTFSFANVSLLDPLSRPQLDVQLVGAAVQLNWTTVAQAEAYVVERKIVSDSQFTVLTETNSPNYTDTEVEEGKTYVYRVRAINDEVESTSIEQTVEIEIILGKEPVEDFTFHIVPNPVQDRVRLMFGKPQSGTVTIVSTQGIKLLTRPVISESVVIISAENLSPGSYLAVFEDSKGNQLTRKFIK